MANAVRPSLLRSSNERQTRLNFLPVSRDDAHQQAQRNHNHAPAATRRASKSGPLLARADELVRQARGRIAVDEPWRPLTAREFDVARLVSEGRTNGEIAKELGIAPKTASSHVEHILAKLGASRRAEIATWAAGVDRSPAPH